MTPEQKKLLEDFEGVIKSMNEQRLAEAPEHVRQLGLVIRRSVRTKSVMGLRRFLVRHKVLADDDQILMKHLRSFRDYLITQRVDLKDLEPAARSRLRQATLRQQDEDQMTSDYKLTTARGESLFCRNCRWFVAAPNDGDGDATKSCVELGTKGADAACFGFKHKSN
jgi:hypothetical protein